MSDQTTVHDVLERIRELSHDERGKGALFERLVAQVLRQDPQYASRLEQVWLWEEWPDRWSSDAGIDLVAREFGTGAYWAIQCKFHDPDHAIQKADVDSFFTQSGKSFETAEGECQFAHRLIVSTTDRWSKKAEEALDKQTIPVARLFFQDLADSPIDWNQLRLDRVEDLRTRVRTPLRAHQEEAIRACLDTFEERDRGKLIMACGTGKTLAAIRLSEQLVPEGGRVLFLAPSITLVGQALRDWTAEAENPVHALVSCSDTKVGKDEEDIRVHDLAFPATTNAGLLGRQASLLEGGRRTVVFSTYQSIQVVADAQQQGLGEFDLVVCDEAHRTTGLTLPGEDPSDFVKVHDNDVIRARKRLYMTATPRIFAEKSKTKAEEKEAVLYSMDDETRYGPEIYRLSFGEAVERDLLADYKVLIVAVNEEAMAPLADHYNAYRIEESDQKPVSIDFATRIIGSWKGLSKKGLKEIDEHGQEREYDEDVTPMRRAVAFSRSIKASKQTTEVFSRLSSVYRESLPEAAHGLVSCELQHVDGTMNSQRRHAALDWLRANSGDDQTCRILSNARCLSEGVDVPALDGVIFFDTRESIVDIVQSVGRVMRKVEGKRYGYVILPVGIPASKVEDYDQHLQRDSRFKGIWKVIKALRAHDESLVDEAEFRRKVDVIDGTPREGEAGDAQDRERSAVQGALDFPHLPIGEISEAVYAAIPKKLGDREYWSEWAREVAQIARRMTTRIHSIMQYPEARQPFDRFLAELHGNINPAVTEDEAVEMLAQHAITRPVFEALFREAQFVENNPVSQAMETALQAIDEYAVSEETQSLSRFYASVHERVKYARSDRSRQEIIRNLYETFFRTAFAKLSERLGIVYTPVEVVDFIVHSADTVLRRHFGRGLTDSGVQIIDPFAGTGTFLVRLLQSGLISADDLPEKFSRELHANEIVLLAYYIAAINIESTYHEQTGSYRSFDGMVLTDTFAMTERDGDRDWEREQRWLTENSARARHQREQDIQVVVGNPPYSAWQESGSEAHANLPYPDLDARIRETYAARSSAQLLNSLYDSYIRAIRWASDRIGEQGIVAFVTNGSFIDGNAADGLRKTLAEEFDHLYVLNLRGNQRTSGEQSRREGGKIFGQGSRAPVAITLMVRTPEQTGECEIHYHDIGDYLSREEKLARLEQFGDVSGVSFERITPNAAAEWINQSDPAFERFFRIGRKRETEGTAIFAMYSSAIKSNRDSWVYNFSRERLAENMRGMIERYNEEVEKIQELRIGGDAKEVQRHVDNDPRRIAWDGTLYEHAGRGKIGTFSDQAIAHALYRPFTKSFFYYDKLFLNRVYQMRQLFPTPEYENRVIAVTGVGASKPFSALVTDAVPNLHVLDTSQCFPLYWYERIESSGQGEQVHPSHRQTSWLEGEAEQAEIFDAGDGVRYVRRDAITNEALIAFRSHYGDESIAKEDIFWFVYGLLHSDQYRARFRNNLRRGLPRIPLVRDFWGFSRGGRELGGWHLNYESVEPWPVTEEADLLMEARDYRIEKMTFGGKPRSPDKTTIVYNRRLTLRDIPLEAYEYQVNGKSPIEWVLERYQVTQDPKSGIVNDPNEYSDDPRYIVDLIRRLVRVSLETRRIVREELPALVIEEEATAEFAAG